MEYFFPRGAEVWVKVLDVRVEGGTGGYADPNDRSGRAGAGAGAEGGRALRGGGRPPSAPKVSLSMKLVDQETGEDLDPGHAACHGGDRGFHLDFGDRGGDPNPPALHSIARARRARGEAVRRLRAAGGPARDVLVPSHQVSENLRFDKEDDDAARVAGVEGVVTRGDAVFVKIVEIKDDPRRRRAAEGHRLDEALRSGLGRGSGPRRRAVPAGGRPRRRRRRRRARPPRRRGRRRPRARLGGHRLGPPRGGREADAPARRRRTAGRRRALRPARGRPGGGPRDARRALRRARAGRARAAAAAAGGPAARRRRDLRGASPRARPGAARVK